MFVSNMSEFSHMISDLMGSHFITSLVQFTSHYTKGGGDHQDLEVHAKQGHPTGPVERLQAIWLGRHYIHSCSHQACPVCIPEEEEGTLLDPPLCASYPVHGLSAFHLGCCELPVNHCNFPGL
jgi:hypothetical protein